MNDQISSLKVSDESTLEKLDKRIFAVGEDSQGFLTRTIKEKISWLILETNNNSNKNQLS